MSVHVSETCNEGDGLWLPLIEYSVKSGVSLSTIRRKIKSNSVQFRLERGKYLVWYAPRTAFTPAPLKVVTDRSEPMKRSDGENESVRMVSEAFEHALKEKDERIRLLERRSREMEDRLKELQLLIRVLEEKYEVRY